MFRSASVLCALLCLNTGIAAAQVADAPAAVANSAEPVVLRQADTDNGKGDVGMDVRVGMFTPLFRF